MESFEKYSEQKKDGHVAMRKKIGSTDRVFLETERYDSSNGQKLEPAVVELSIKEQGRQLIRLEELVAIKRELITDMEIEAAKLDPEPEEEPQE